MSSTLGSAKSKPQWDASDNMISKRVFIKPGNDNYARLANYIADAGHSGEKCLLSWAEGMLGGEEYAEGISEAIDVQARNTRAASKTYHLVISFRPETHELNYSANCPMPFFSSANLYRS